MLRNALALVFAALLANDLLAQVELVTALKGLDPVELVQGREVPGSENVSTARGKHRYLFASDANRETFQ